MLGDVVKYTPDQILDAAIALIAAEGVGVSTSRVARAAGVSNGTLFNYFPTKQELLDAIYLRIKLQLAAAIGEWDDDAPLRDVAWQVWHRWVAWASGHRDAWLVGRLLHGGGLVGESAVAEAMAALAGPMSLVDRLHRLRGDAGLPADYVGAVIQAQLDAVIELRLDDAGVALAFDVMWSGLTARTLDRTLVPTGERP